MKGNSCDNNQVCSNSHFECSGNRINRGGPRHLSVHALGEDIGPQEFENRLRKLDDLFFIRDFLSLRSRFDANRSGKMEQFTGILVLE